MPECNLCSIDGCGNRAKVRGLCNAHYLRERRHGTPLGGNRPRGDVARWIDVAVALECDECVIWPFSRTNKGYGHFRSGGVDFTAHRHICERAHGPAPEGKPWALHSCGNGHGGCVNKRHLRWGTPAENQADRVVDETSNHGERCGTSKLKEADAIAIADRLRRGERASKIADDYGVHYVTVHDINTGRSWAFLTGASLEARLSPRRYKLRRTKAAACAL